MSGSTNVKDIANRAGNALRGTEVSTRAGARPQAVAGPSEAAENVEVVSPRQEAPVRQEAPRQQVGGQVEPTQQGVVEEQQQAPLSGIDRSPLDDMVRRELGQLASPPAYSSTPRLPENPSERVVGMVNRMAANDTPHANEAGNASTTSYAPGEVSAMRDIERERNANQLAAEKEAAVASDESTEQAAEEAEEAVVDEMAMPSLSAEKRERRESMRQAAPDPKRKKPSILDRAIGRQPRIAGQRNTDNMKTTRPANIVNTLMKQISNSFGTHGIGYRVYGKMNPLPMLGYRDVGIGIQVLRAVVEQNSEMLDKLIAQSIPKEEKTDFVSSRMMTTSDLADFINAHNIEVFTAKPPNNRGQDVQRRRLVILESIPRGIYLHPYMAAMYTADFDGDDMEISFDPKVRWGARDPMDHMVGIDGEQSFDMKFIPVHNIKKGWNEDHPNYGAWEYARDIMLEKWSSWDMSEEVLDYYGDLIKSIVKISDSALKDSDAQAKAYGDMFKAARDWADAASNGKKGRSDRLMSDVTRAVIDGMRNLSVTHALFEVGEVIPRDSMPPAFTPDDNALYATLDGMVSGATPNNFQELKIMMNGFLGNVDDKNAAFRFTADVGKMMKLDKRYIIGKEYVIPKDNDDAMTDLLQKTLKYKYSRRMTVDVKTAGKSMYFSEILRNRVIAEVGMPDDPWEIEIDPETNMPKLDENGDPVKKIRKFSTFLSDFAKSYNRNASIINQANLVWLENMGIDSNTNRRTVNPIKHANTPTLLTMKDVATPFIETYGNYSIERMFHGWYNTHEDKDPRKNTDGKKKTEEDLTYVSEVLSLRARYSSMSLKSFSVNNMISLHMTNDKDLIKTTVQYNIGGNRYDQSDNRLIASLIAAIADKKTSTSSKFNKNVLGMVTSENGDREGPLLTGDNGKNTVVANMCDLLMDIRRLDTEGKLIEPLPTMQMCGYYAGIGSRNTPLEVRKKMEEVAKRLRDKGMHLRSGHARGADQAFEKGAGDDATIYLPTGSFESEALRFKNARYVRFGDLSESDRQAARDSVIKYHPWGKSLRAKYDAAKVQAKKQGRSVEDIKGAFGYLAHRRNYFQVMGANGEQQSAFVVCWTPVRHEQDLKYNYKTKSWDQQDNPTGHGTEQALRIARDNNIPIFNAADYDDLDEWANDVIDAAEKLIQNQLYKNGTADQMLRVDDAIMALNASNYEMFRDLGMDTTAGFLTSEFGRALLENADNPDVVAGIREAMVFAWKTKRITEITSEIREIEKMPDPTLSRYMDLKNQALFSMDELSETSHTWRGLIREMKDGRAFAQLKTAEGRGRTYWEAPDFWRGDNEYANASDYHGIRDVIEDLSMPWSLKCDIITDVVRWQLNYIGLKSFEIAYQLEVGGNASYTINSSPTKAAMEVFHDMESASTRYANKGMLNMQREVQTAAYHWREVDGQLTNALSRLASCPWERVAIDDRVYADGILAVREKTYAQTEKAKKHPATNYTYSAVSLQRNGGQFNDVYRLDDRLLGLQHKSKLNAGDIARVLSDPTYVLSVYDDDGAVGYLTQQLLLGIDHNASEQEIWDWLIANPRIAGTLRQGAACVISDTKSKGYIGAQLSLDETIGSLGRLPYTDDKMGNIKYLMRDHPVYGGLISLLTPAHGKVARNDRNKVPVIEETVCIQLYNAAKENEDAEKVLSNLGITVDRLHDLLITDFDKYMMAALKIKMNTRRRVERDTIKEARAEAEDIYDTLSKYINDYIDEIQQNMQLALLGDEPPRRSLNLFGRNTISSFHNTFLSNFHEVPIKFGGLTYRNAEAAFQAQKCANPSDRKQFTKLTGGEARSLGRNVKLREDWEEIKVDIMREVVHAKFSDPKLRKMLEDTGDKMLIEGNTWNDTTWGVANGTGQNLLGKILMEERGVPGDETDGIMPDIDLESIASFWDTIQELSGSKVAVSTGVEGRETYDLSYWMQHLHAKDKYADLEAIERLIGSYENPAEFDGKWTNKGPLSVSVDANGNVTTNVEQLKSLKANDRDEIVVEVPDGFIVPDRSTDTHGNQVSSLNAVMVSKRSNGAEKFNLKAMKAGLDGTDSISKMREKYSMVEYADNQRLPTFVLELRQQLAATASSGGIQAARMQLAQMMMNQDREMGYKDMGLSNYMCLADVMLIQDEQGGLILRSLEQLAVGLRGRLGARVQYMSDEEVSDAIQRIAFDTSEQGIGLLRVWDSNELLSDMRPNGSANGAQTSMKVSSSVFANNLELLDKIIRENTTDEGMPSVLDQTQVEDMNRRVTEESIEGVTDVFNRSSVVRNYSVVGYVGEGSVGDDEIKEGEIYDSVGPLYMWVIGEGKVRDDEIGYLCDQAYKLGLTVLVARNHVDKVPDKYKADLIPAGDSGDMMLPMFDMRLNGSEAMPFEPKFAIFQAPPSRYFISAEDPNNVFTLGDAQYKFTRAAIDAVRVRSDGKQIVSAQDLFPNVYANEKYKNCTFSVGYASRDAIDFLIANPNHPQCTIDYGMLQTDEGFGQHVHDINRAIERYKRNLASVEDDRRMGFIKNVEVQPGDIVAWALLDITKNGRHQGYVMSPVIPFPLHGTKTNPEKFVVTKINNLKNDGSQMVVEWAFDRPMAEGGYAKFFDSSGGANKGMITLSTPIEDDMRLKKNGMSIHAYCAAQSTDSRKIGTDRRIKTMISLMAIARMQGYNFARMDNTFPKDSDLKEIANTRVPREVWSQKLSTGKDIVFVGGRSAEVRKLNAFLNYEVRKIWEDGGNPTDYLACKFTNENGDDYNSCVMWEFECMFSNSLNYEDSLLKFMHFVDPSLCPNGLDDNSEDKLFRLYPGEDFDRGILQAKVPYPVTDPKTGRQMISYVWSNIAVGMSFFGEESSYNSRPNVVGASDMLDSANTRAYYDDIDGLTPNKVSLRAAWATAEEGWPPKDAGAIGKLGWL